MPLCGKWLVDRFTEDLGAESRVDVGAWGRGGSVLGHSCFYGHPWWFFFLSFSVVSKNLDKENRWSWTGSLFCFHYIV